MQAPSLPLAQSVRTNMLATEEEEEGVEEIVRDEELELELERLKDHANGTVHDVGDML